LRFFAVDRLHTGKRLALQINFLIGIAVARHHLQVHNNPRTMFDSPPVRLPLQPAK